MHLLDQLADTFEDSRGARSSRRTISAFGVRAFSWSICKIAAPASFSSREIIDVFP